MSRRRAFSPSNTMYVTVRVMSVAVVDNRVPGRVWVGLLQSAAAAAAGGHSQCGTASISLVEPGTKHHARITCSMLRARVRHIVYEVLLTTALEHRILVMRLCLPRAAFAHAEGCCYCCEQRWHCFVINEHLRRHVPTPHPNDNRS